MARDGTGTEDALDVRLKQAGPIPLDVTLCCAPGELLALVGPSGSGKSTVLRTIAGLYRPASGRVAVGSDVWFDHGARVWVRPQERKVGFVFQDYALFPHLTAIEQTAMPFRHLPPDERSQAARGLLARVHLDGLQDRRPAQLSGGQRQRVAIARALARSPRVLLLDEPFSAVDHMTREPLKLELAQLRATLATPIILVTHDLDEAFALSDRVSILAEGRTLQTAPPDEIRRRPASLEVARLLGETNAIEAQVVTPSSAGEPGLIRWAGGELRVADTGVWKPGSSVAAILLSDGLSLARCEAPSASVITGHVTDLVRLGKISTCLFIPATARAGSISVKVTSSMPTLAALGAEVMLNVDPASIHLIPRSGRTS